MSEKEKNIIEEKFKSKTINEDAVYVKVYYGQLLTVLLIDANEIAKIYPIQDAGFVDKIKKECFVVQIDWKIPYTPPFQVIVEKDALNDIRNKINA